MGPQVFLFPRSLALALWLPIAAVAVGGCERTIAADPDEYVGVGVELTMVAAGARVVRVLETSPAAQAGVVPDDVVLSVDRESVRGLSLAETVDRLRGRAGSSVEVLVKRKDGNHTLTLTRQRIMNH